MSFIDLEKTKNNVYTVSSGESKKGKSLILLVTGALIILAVIGFGRTHLQEFDSAKEAQAKLQPILQLRTEKEQALEQAKRKENEAVKAINEAKTQAEIATSKSSQIEQLTSELAGIKK